MNTEAYPQGNPPAKRFTRHSAVRVRGGDFINGDGCAAMIKPDQFKRLIVHTVATLIHGSHIGCSLKACMCGKTHIPFFSDLANRKYNKQEGEFA